MNFEDARIVGDIVQLVRGTTYKGELVGKPGPALLGLGSIIPGGGFRSRDFKTYGGECPEKLMLRPGDLFVSLKGATKDGEMIGSVARVPPEVASGRLTQDTVKLVLKPEAEPFRAYLYWWLRTPAYRDYCAGRARGSAVVALSREDFLSYPLPSVTQFGQVTVDLLDRIDDKIELNRRMNETLEAMARALFRDWFVDFGPTRAKIEGRAPYLAPDLWPLFPDRLDDEGKPEGWEMRSVYNFADVIYGAPFASKLFNTVADGVPLIRIRDLSDHSPGVFTTEMHPKGHMIEPGDIVVGMDGEFRLHVWKGNPAWLNQRVCHFEPVKGVPKQFLVEALKTPLEFFERGKVGTTVIHLGKGDIDTFKLIFPGNELLHAFGNASDPLLAKIVENEREARTLAQTRDLLLPRLMSGELRVAGSERTPAEVL